MGLALVVIASPVIAGDRCAASAPAEVKEAVRVFESNPKRAHVLLTRANALGDPDGAFNLGLLHMKGLGVPKSQTNALPFFRSAATCGHTPAQLNAAQILMESSAGQAEAAKWFAAAAAGGNRTAAYNMAHMYDEGVGVRPDGALAHRYYMMAAQQDHASAQWKLAVSYSLGNGVKRIINAQSIGCGRPRKTVIATRPPHWKRWQSRGNSQSNA